MLHLPTPEATARMISTLLGRSVTVAGNKVSDARLSIVGTCRSGEMPDAEVCLMDAVFGAYAGAALSMMPVDALPAM